jgi:hypothetical protein
MHCRLAQLDWSSSVDVGSWVDACVPSGCADAALVRGYPGPSPVVVSVKLTLHAVIAPDMNQLRCAGWR